MRWLVAGIVRVQQKNAMRESRIFLLEGKQGKRLESSSECCDGTVADDEVDDDGFIHANVNNTLSI